MLVVIVGNSPYSKDAFLGEWIDSCDTVIRCNNFVISGHEKWIGSKTDIWTIVQNPWCVVDKRHEQFREIWRICNRTPPANPEYFLPLIGQTQSCIIGADYIGQIMPAINGNLPSTGCVATVFAISRFGPVYVVNFSHFSSSAMHYYSDGKPENCTHNGPAERDFFNSLRAQKKILDLPEDAYTKYSNYPASKKKFIVW